MMLHGRIAISDVLSINFSPPSPVNDIYSARNTLSSSLHLKAFKSTSNWSDGSEMGIKSTLLCEPLAILCDSRVRGYVS